jgi:serine/threonine protein kinase
MLSTGSADGRGIVGKVGDFGLSLKMDHLETHLSNVYQGTMTHMAPEIMLDGRVSKAADVYGECCMDCTCLLIKLLQVSNHCSLVLLLLPASFCPASLQSRSNFLLKQLLPCPQRLASRYGRCTLALARLKACPVRCWATRSLASTSARASLTARPGPTGTWRSDAGSPTGRRGAAVLLLAVWAEVLVAGVDGVGVEL